MDVTLKDIILPVEGHEIWDYSVIGLFFLSLLTMFLMGDKSDQQDMAFVSLVVFICVLDKAYAMGYIFEPEGVTNPTREQRIETHITHFATFAMRVLIFVLPLVTAGKTRIPRVRAANGFLAIVGGIYVFARWFFEQRPDGTIGFIEPQILLQGSMFVLVFGELVARNFFRSINGHCPISVAWVLPPDDAEIEVT